MEIITFCTNLVLHYLLINACEEGLYIVTEKYSKEELREFFAIKNDDGETPLHSISDCPASIILKLIDFDLGPVWEILE